MSDVASWIAIFQELRQGFFSNEAQRPLWLACGLVLKHRFILQACVDNRKDEPAITCEKWLLSRT
jgi:hypothetical protein